MKSIMLEIDRDDDLFIGDEILKEYFNCLECGLCCQFFDSLPLYEEEIYEIAAFLSIDKKIFYTNFMKKIKHENSNIHFSLKTPCPFQKKTTCQIYEKRSLLCRTFPLCINLTRNEAILTGIYVCPQATQFYEAMLEFFRLHQPPVYQKLLEKEKQLSIDKNGMKIQGPAILFSFYLDWLYSK